MTPGVQRVMADGSVGYLAANGFNAPNDVTVTHDGNIVLTDPGIPNHDPAYAGGRVLAIRPDGAIDVIADSLFYPNGILALRDGSVVVTERQGVLRIDRSGRRTWIVENIGGRVDGLAADSDNRLFVAGQAGLQVIAADGVLLEFLAIPGANTTNCCFGGPDLRWLFVTDAAAGTVLVCRDIDATGEPVTLWRAPTPH